MPSTRASKATGGGGILRRKDGTVLEIQFSTKNPLFKEERQAMTKDGKPSDYKALYALLTIQEDGRAEFGPSIQPIKVGDAKDYEIVCDGRGLSGTRGFNKTSPWIIFLESLANPTGGEAGFPEDKFPEDPAGLVADYSNIRGVRLMFDWAKDESDWAKKNPRKVEAKDGKPAMSFPRENLVVAQFYNQVDVASLPKAPVAGKPAAPATPQLSGSKAGVTKTIDAGLVQATAEDQVQTVLGAAKDKTLTRNKLSVKLLNSMASLDDGLREAVRTFALDGANLAKLEGVTFNQGTDTVTYTPVA